MTSEKQEAAGKVIRDTAVVCVGIVLRSFGRQVTDSEVRANWANTPDEQQNIRSLLKKYKLKADFQKIVSEQLTEITIPAIARIKTGEYVVLGQCSNGKIMVVDPQVGHAAYILLDRFLQAWDGQIILIEEPFSVEKWMRKLNLKWFLMIIKRYRHILGETLIAAFFLQLLGLMMPFFTQVIIDKVLPNDGLSTLDVLASCMVVLILIQTVMSILRTYVMNHATTKIDILLGIQLFRQIVGLPLQYFESRRVGDTLLRVAALNSIREFLTGSALSSLLDILFSVVFLIVMFSYSVPLTLLSLLLVPLGIIQNFLIAPIYQRKLENVWAANAASNSFLVEAITGIHTIKALAIEPQFVHRWEKILTRNVQTAFDSSTFTLFSGNSTNLLQSMVGLGVLWYGGYFVMQGTLTIGQLIAFQMMASQANSSLMKLLSMWPNVQQVGLGLMRLSDIIKSPIEAAYLAPAAGGQAIKGDIVLDNVNFRYRPEGNLIINKVSLHIPIGARVGIVGRSGSGKSTLTKLIQRLYLPESGRVLLDGIDSQQMNVEWLRRQVGVVLQDNYLFKGSVRDNICTAAPSAPIENVIKAAKTAGAHEFILELNEGYDTEVGERGISLSGGQRQRIAIARALLTNPKIMIFDEATSALDYESERIILDNLDAICANRTMLMIAHRLSTVRSCDLIIVMEHGQVIECGNHQELMDKQGLYYNLYLQQEG
jgi:subfamily B ATP-binding cassette protein HlyB/CyaB